MMRRLVLLLLLPLLAACGALRGQSPTPFPTPAASPSATAAGPVVLTVTELANAPGLYVDTVVQVSGQFRKQPILVCDSEPHPSPATWGLAEAGLVAPAGGYEAQVRGLLPEGLTMTVEGRWRRWEGLVGCGKSATTQEVWYLDVARILSPSPLVQVTLTPGAPGTEVAGLSPTPGGEATLPAATDDGSLFPTPLTEEGTPPPTSPPGGYPGEPGEPFPTEPFPEEVETVSPLATTPPAGIGQGTPTPAVSGTPTITGTPGTATPTVTGTPPTATASPTGGASGQVVEKGDLRDLAEEFASTTVAAGQVDSWTMEIFEEETYTVYAIAAAPADLVLTLLRDGQTLVDRQNTAPPGEPETIVAPSGAVEGMYEVRVSVQGGTAAEYAILVNTDNEFPISIRGMVAPGTPRNAVQLVENGVNYWFFVGEAGDNVTIVVDPSSGDPYVDLYGPGAEYLTSADAGFDGETETLTFALATTGLHAISIAEIEGLDITYNLSVTLN
jgi:hypothetical protein